MISLALTLSQHEVQHALTLEPGQTFLIAMPVEPQPVEGADSWTEANGYYQFWKADGSGKDWPSLPIEERTKSPYGKVGDEFSFDAGTLKIDWQDGPVPAYIPDLALTLKSLSVKRVQYVTEGEAEMMGFKSTAVVNSAGDDYKGSYACEYLLYEWNSRHHDYPWKTNPWTWIAELEKVR